MAISWGCQPGYKDVAGTTVSKTPSRLITSLGKAVAILVIQLLTLLMRLWLLECLYQEGGNAACGMAD